jgi:hypothetical protein
MPRSVGDKGRAARASCATMAADSNAILSHGERHGGEGNSDPSVDEGRSRARRVGAAVDYGRRSVQIPTRHPKTCRATGDELLPGHLVIARVTLEVGWAIVVERTDDPGHGTVPRPPAAPAHTAISALRNARGTDCSHSLGPPATTGASVGNGKHHGVGERHSWRQEIRGSCTT